MSLYLLPHLHVRTGDKGDIPFSVGVTCRLRPYHSALARTTEGEGPALTQFFLFVYSFIIEGLGGLNCD